MKNRLIENIPFIICSIIVIVLFTLGIFEMIKENYRIEENMKNYYETNCKIEQPIFDKETCEIASLYKDKNTYNSLLSLAYMTNTYNNPLIIIAVMLMPTALLLSRWFKSKNLINELNRKNYNKIKKELILKNYKNVIIFAVMLLVLLISVRIINGSFSNICNLSNQEYCRSTDYNTSATGNIPFIIVYFLSNILICLYYINVVLIVFRKYHNFFVGTLISIITLIGIELFNEIILGIVVLGSILRDSSMMVILNTMNVIHYNTGYGIFPPFIFTMCIFIVSFIIVLKVYKDKEKLIIDLEGEN